MPTNHVYISRVELHQGDAGIRTCCALLVEEGVEAADDIRGDARHGSGAVQQDLDVCGGGSGAFLLRVLHGLCVVDVGRSVGEATGRTAPPKSAHAGETRVRIMQGPAGAPARGALTYA
jgi:hypothetical protein